MKTIWKNVCTESDTDVCVLLWSTSNRTGSLTNLSAYSKFPFVLSVQIGIDYNVDRSHMRWRNADHSLTGHNLAHLSEIGHLSANFRWPKYSCMRRMRCVQVCVFLVSSQQQLSTVLKSIDGEGDNSARLLTFSRVWCQTLFSRLIHHQQISCT